MFRHVSPVLPVIDMAEARSFWEKLGLRLAFVDTSGGADDEYIVMRREELVLHLQKFAPEDHKATQVMALRIEMESREQLEALYQEWLPQGFITAKLKDQPWGNYEFGFYAPGGAPFFFFVDSE